MCGDGYGYNGMMSGGFGSVVAVWMRVNLSLRAGWLDKQINK